MSIEVNATEQIIEVNATGSTIDINVNSQTVDVNATTSVIDVEVSNGPGPAGPGVPTGGTTGQVLKKLSNSDYDTYWAVDTQGVPYIGATGDVDLGEYELKAGQVEFDQSPTGTAGVGVMRWNNTDGTLDLGLKGGNVTLQVGEDIVARVVNKTGGNLLASNYQVVRVSSAQGQRLAVTLAQGNNDNNSADTLGLVIENINNNQEGWIQILGQLTEVNTTGSLQGETWADGDVLYLSPTTAGALTNVKPVAPQHIVVLGYVEYAHSQHGKIYVKVMNGWELGELHDVNTTGATAGQVLKYNGTIWTPSSDSGITSLNSLTATSQTFATGTSGTDFNISSSTSTHTFNLPTASATNRGLLSSTDFTTFNNKQNTLTLTTTGTSGAATLIGSTLNIPQYSGTNIYNSDGTLTANRTLTQSTFSLTFAGTTSTRFHSTGNLTIGGTVDAGYKIDVNGTGRFTGNVTIGTTPASQNITLDTTSATQNILFFKSGSYSSYLWVDTALSHSSAAGGGTYLPFRGSAFNANNASLSDGMVNLTSGSLPNIVRFFATGVIEQGVIGYAAGGTTMQFRTNKATSISNGSLAMAIFENTNVAINSATDFPSAQLSVTSTTKGFLQPTMTTTQRNAIVSPATGLSIYNTTTNTLDYYNGTSWVSGQTSITTGNLTETGSSILTISGGTNAVIGSGMTIQVAKASGSTNGFLSSTDWTTFNNKQNALTNPITGTGTSGQVAYWSGTNTQTGSNNLFWDNANGRLGIGTNAPTTILDVYSSSLIASVFKVGTSQNFSIFANTQSSNRFQLFNISRIGSPTIEGVSIGMGTGPTAASGIISANNDNLIFGYAFSGAFNETFRINTAKNLLLGITTDSGQRLQVNGTALFTGSVTGTGNSSTYTVTASSGVARSKSITSTLVAAANNNILIGLDINPTFTNGAFSGVINTALRIQNGDFNIVDKDIVLGTTTGTKIGTATSQKIGFWNATPIVQPTTAVAAATFTANTGTAVNDASTFDGYTMAQVVKALRNAGLLA